MESIRIPYNSDSYGKPLYARVSWSKDSQPSPRPIVVVYHGGGLLVGSSEIIPKVQIDYLCDHGFVVVIPNYRLAPQVTASEAFADGEEAYDWSTTTLLKIMADDYDVELDPSRVVSYGHSSGGTLAMHIGSCRPLKAVTAFYPSLFSADNTTSAHKPTSAVPFGMMPDFNPTDEDWNTIKPADHQVSEAPMARPGTIPPPRNKWQMSILKNGQWLSTVQPDGRYELIDPMTRLSAQWPPVMIVQGEIDNVPGSSRELAQRAEKEIKAAGVKEVRLEVVHGESHMFDLPPTVGTTDLGPKWEAVVKGLEWLRSHV
ncbi:hypothetical protein LTR36_002316 [Oleoguttula mirabilis]|uniref:Alpha/beta hydrolase fold-3 domain-containing protein n=1 Tax=Oleoguttula mirabilis TaxID=1507867 RepID=A0AAV9JLM5_9PEZI|nr:hypothetical protein LTR36_002316 [Oleoguttula mirabilis]